MAEKYPLASKIIDQSAQAGTIYIAGLYHDIAKGRGGDHSELGAVDAEAFCQSHQLPLWDGTAGVLAGARTTGVSTTALTAGPLRPRVMFDFAQLVGDRPPRLPVRAAVADINATNRHSGTLA